MKLDKSSLFLILMTPFLGQAQTRVTHTVVKSEYLSTILYRLGLKPIYGKNGTIAQTIELNPELLKSKGNQLFPGQKILLPVTIEVASPEIPNNIPKNIPKPDEPKISTPERLPSEDVSDDAAALITVAGGLDFFRIEGVDESTGDNSTILSEASPSVMAGYNLLWNDRTTFSFNAKIQKYKLQDLTGDDQSFDDDSGNKVDLSFRMIKKYSDRWFLGGGVAFEQDLFFHAVTATKLGVDKVLITKPEVHARYVAFEKSNANIGFDGKLGANLSNKTNIYKIKTGNHYGVGTYFKYHSKFFDQNYKSLEAKVFYSVDNQDTSVSTRKLTNLSFMIHYDWKLPW